MAITTRKNKRDTIVSQERTGMKYRELIIILTGVLAATLMDVQASGRSQAAIRSDLGMAYLDSAQYNDDLRELLTSERHVFRKSKSPLLRRHHIWARI